MGKTGNKSLGRYVIKRILFAIPVFFAITFLVYLLISLAPTNYADVVTAGQQMTEAEYQAVLEQYDLDKPIPVRYVKWLRNFVKGNWGESYNMHTPVLGVIKQRIGPSILLSVTGMILGVIIGIPLGIMAGYKPNSGWDHVSSGICAVSSALPVFFLGLLLMYVFCVKLPWPKLPTYGMYTDNNVHTLPDLLRHLILPATMIALQSVTSYIKQTRNALLEVVNEEYIKTARSKGISERSVVVRHAFRNALSPVITSVALSIPHMVAGSVVTEQIFSWPGMGSLMINAIVNHDYPVIMGVTVLIAIAVLAAGIIADILYAAADPRVSYN